jgi:hypothetical protein
MNFGFWHLIMWYRKRGRKERGGEKEREGG